MRRRRSLSKSIASAAVAGVVLLAAATGRAYADPCVQGCRGAHNACRMATKLLSSPLCDAQLQACIGGCFASGRFARDRDLHGPPDLGAPRDFGRSRDMGRFHDFGGFRDRR